MVTIYENQSSESKEAESEKSKNDVEEDAVKVDSEAGLSIYSDRFLSAFEKNLANLKKSGEPSIQVSEVLGGLARLYERIRTTVEYKGEHVLRRNAIERILKRLVWQEESVRADVNNRRVAESLLKELIWARYLPNNTVPRGITDVVEKAVDKYIYFLRNLDSLPSGISETKVRNWIWGVASSEIEDIVDPSYRELYVKLMYDWFIDTFNWEEPELDEHDKQIQIYLAIHRAFTKSDDSIMRYHLLLKEFPDWKHADRTELNKFILKYSDVYSEIEGHLNFSGRLVLYRKIQKNAAAFDVFKEIAIEEKLNLRKLVNDQSKFEEKVRKVCEAKYKQMARRVSTGIIRSIIYIFLTKVVFAMLIEIPYEIFMYGDVRYFPLAINMILPPSIMWLVGFSIRVPGAKNTESIVTRLASVSYKQKEKVKQNFSLKKLKRSSVLSSFFGLLYALIFVAVFGGITYVLTLLNFSIFGVLIFFMFLSLVMLFAFRVRFNASQLKVNGEDEGFFSHLSSYFTLPFLNFGFYLSRGLAKLNFFTILLDFLIEIPLKNIIEVFEEWTSFLREKKEEVVEMPE